MSEQALTILKWCLLAALYLFLFRVLRTVWAEVREPATVGLGRKGSRRASTRRATASPRASLGTLVIVESPDGRSGSFPLVEDQVIGRDPDCAVRIDDTFISTHHARVLWHDAALRLEDLGSTNGTFVNGERVVGSSPLRTGDQIRLGGTVLELK